MKKLSGALKCCPTRHSHKCTTDLL